LQRQIQNARQKKRDGNVRARFENVDVMDLIRATPKMNRHVTDFSAVILRVVQLAVDVVLQREGQRQPETNQKNNCSGEPICRTPCPAPPLPFSG
jgi:hypothetical protein